MTSIFDILSTPLAPPPAGCAKAKKEDRSTPAQYILLSQDDFKDILSKDCSEVQSRIDTFGLEAAKYLINVKYAPNTQTKMSTPIEDNRIKEALAGLADNQKKAVTAVLANLLVERLSDKYYQLALAGSDRAEANQSGIPYSANLSVLNAAGQPYPRGPIILKVTYYEMNLIISKAKETISPEACPKVTANDQDASQKDRIDRNRILARGKKE